MNNNFELKGVLNEGVAVYYQGEKASITSLTINDEGELVIVLDSGTSVVVGKVVGDKGDTGAPGGFGTISATAESLATGSSPVVSVEATGDNAAKNLYFSFKIPKGDKGDIGTLFTPHVNSDGDLSWSNDGGLSNPETVNIKGGRGDRGDRGYQIGSIELINTGGTSGVPGTYDIYVVKLDDPDNTVVGEFSVYNGKNGDGAGDMVAATYDTDGDGVIDNANNAYKLGGKLPEEYAIASSIPTKTSDIVNDSGYITIDDVPKQSETAANSEKLGGELPEYYAAVSDIPSDISQLTNDVGFITESVVNEKITGLVDSAPETLNTLSKLAVALGEKVPQTRKINGYILTNDISLSADDVGADKVGTASANIGTHNNDASAHQGLFDSKVPVTRRVNGMDLSQDISLDAGSVGADVIGTAESITLEHNNDENAHSSLFSSIQRAPQEKHIVPIDGQADGALLENTVYAIDLRGATTTLSPPTSSKNIDLFWIGGFTRFPIPFFLHTENTYVLRFNTSCFLDNGVDTLSLSLADSTEAFFTQSLSSIAEDIEINFTNNYSSTNIVLCDAVSSSGSFAELVSIPATIEGYFGWAHGQILVDSTTNITFSAGSKFAGEVPDFSEGLYEFDVLNGVWAFTEVVTE